MPKNIKEEMRELITQDTVYQAITTKYMPPTARLGARIKVTAYAGRRFYGWDYELSSEENHQRAAYLFAKDLCWLKDGVTMAGGAMSNGTGNCYVLIDKK